MDWISVVVTAFVSIAGTSGVWKLYSEVRKSRRNDYDHLLSRQRAVIDQEVARNERFEALLKETKNDLELSKKAYSDLMVENLRLQFELQQCWKCQRNEKQES